MSDEDGRGIGHGITLEDGSEEHLSPEDLTICFDGKFSLRMATVTATLRTFKPAASLQCRTSAVCKKALRDVLFNLEDNVDALLNGNPFADYTSFMQSADLVLCPSCKAMIEARSLKERKDVWKRLPELLGIEVPGWGEQPPSADAK